MNDNDVNWQRDFWQLVMDVGYLMEGENQAYERERMKGLAEALGNQLHAHPEIDLTKGPLEHFAMYAVARLAQAFVFNDSIGSDEPNFKERMMGQLVQGVGGPEQFAEMLSTLLNDEH